MYSCQILGTGTNRNEYQDSGLLPPLLDTAVFSKILVPTYQTTWHHILEDLIFNIFSVRGKTLCFVLHWRFLQQWL
jgi:hypothetical protein